MLATEFIFGHEMGHALQRQLLLANLGLEEDAADAQLRRPSTPSTRSGGPVRWPPRSSSTRSPARRPS
ncbi:hypothetical protein ACU686_22350 [Yinghuangia aomiensis]